MELQDILTELLKEPEVQNDNRKLMKIADILLLLDSTDENGVQLKCYVLNKFGKPGQARNFYNLFYSEYEKLLNNEYPKSFEEIPESNLFITNK